MKIIDIKGILIIIVVLLFFNLLSSCETNRQEKTMAIINKFKLVETQYRNLKLKLEALKYQATGNDSVKIIEIEKQLTEKEITKRLVSAFNEEFSDKEINDIYEFIQTSAFDKFFNSRETYQVFASKFNDIDEEIKTLTQNFSKTAKKPTNKFKPISVDRADGFYETVNYSFSTDDKDIKLKNKPSLTLKDILEVKKVYSRNNENRPEISIIFTKEGAQKFYLLTKENIGKPIAIVIDKQIVSLPTVNFEIMDGKVNISGNFSEKEIDKMIQKLKNK